MSLKPRSFEKKYCFPGKGCFNVDKNLTKRNLDKLNKNPRISLTSVSGGLEKLNEEVLKHPSKFDNPHILFYIPKQTDIKKAKRFLKESIPDSNIECVKYKNANHCSVYSKHQFKKSWWNRAADVISKG